MQMDGFQLPSLHMLASPQGTNKSHFRDLEGVRTNPDQSISTLSAHIALRTPRMPWEPSWPIHSHIFLPWPRILKHMANQLQKSIQSLDVMRRSEFFGLTKVSRKQIRANEGQPQPQQSCSWSQDELAMQCIRRHRNALLLRKSYRSENSKLETVADGPTKIMTVQTLEEHRGAVYNDGLPTPTLHYNPPRPYTIISLSICAAVLWQLCVTESIGRHSASRYHFSRSTFGDESQSPTAWQETTRDISIYVSKQKIIQTLSTCYLCCRHVRGIVWEEKSSWKLVLSCFLWYHLLCGDVEVFLSFRTFLVQTFYEAKKAGAFMRIHQVTCFSLFFSAPIWKKCFSIKSQALTLPHCLLTQNVSR